MSAQQKRSGARSCAVQALYQWQLAGQDIAAIINYFFDEGHLSQVDDAYFRALLRGVSTRLDEIDAAIKPALERALGGLDPVEKAILRLGTYELLAHPEIPYKVVINEAVELAKTFGGTDGHKFVNGVLDKIAPTLRPIEVQTARKKAD